MNRRKFITTTSSLSLPVIAGCTGGSDGPKDTDGDGMIDSKDYAPNDAAVQEKSDIDSSEESQQEKSKEESQSKESNPTTESEETTQQERTTEESTSESIEYPSHRGTHRITGTEDYWAWEFSVPERFDLAYTVRNDRPSEYDFDALVFTPDEFQDYQEKVSGDDAHPDSVDTASLEAVSTKQSRQATLDAGRHCLVRATRLISEG